MTTLINDELLESRLLAERQASGADRFDEVWEGIYVMAPLANNEHGQIQGDLLAIFKMVLGFSPDTFVGMVNVSDREDDWTKNYRCPDLSVFLPGTQAQDRDSHWFGGPDLAVEIVSPKDRSREKLAFYFTVGVRELLIIDRDPWALELYRPSGNTMALVARSTPASPSTLSSSILPLTFQLSPATGARPRIEVARTNGADRWSI